MKKIAILLENIFDERELIYPYYRLLEAGYEVHLVGTEKDTVYTGKTTFTETSTHASKDIQAKDYAAVVVPGGFSPDYMRRVPATVDFVREMDALKKPIAAICHGPWMLASAVDIKGKKVTGAISIKDDLTHAGATFVDEEVVISEHIITSRSPKDMIAFVKAIIEAIEA